jgi:hypothetical protein
MFHMNETHSDLTRTLSRTCGSGLASTKRNRPQTSEGRIQGLSEQRFDNEIVAWCTVHISIAKLFQTLNKGMTSARIVLEG